MSEELTFDNMPIGLDMGVMEVTLDEKTVNDRLELVLWEDRESLDKLNIAPPGMGIVQHAMMQFAKFPSMKAGIWAKSEHEFLKPMKIGSKIFIRGKIVNKYVKRGKKYAVTEFTAVDESGEVLLRSWETDIRIE